MKTAIEIRLTSFGCQVTVGTRIMRFGDVDLALEFARRWLEAAADLRDLSYRCE